MDQTAEIKPGKPTIDSTLALIEDAFRTKTKDGKPKFYDVMEYHVHCIRVMKRLILFPGGGKASEDERMAALLHDIKEDTTYTEEDLRQMGYSEETITMVNLLTSPDKPPGLTSDQKWEFTLKQLNRIIDSGNVGAIRIKLADNMDNSDTKVMIRSTPKKRQQYVENYARQRVILERGLAKAMKDTAPSMFNG